MDIRNKDEFIIFMQRATEDTSNDCYIELYNILLRWEGAGFTPLNINDWWILKFCWNYDRSLHTTPNNFEYAIKLELKIAGSLRRIL